MTATWLDACNAVRSRFDALVTSALSLPTQHDNANMVPPEDEPWCRLRLDAGRTTMLEQSGDGNTYHTPFIATASLFAPLALGDQAVLALADQITAAFQSRTVGVVVYYSPAVGNLKRSGSQWRLDVTIPFYLEDQG